VLFIVHFSLLTGRFLLLFAIDNQQVLFSVQSFRESVQSFFLKNRIFIFISIILLVVCARNDPVITRVPINFQFRQIAVNDVQSLFWRSLLARITTLHVIARHEAISFNTEIAASEIPPRNDVGWTPVIEGCFAPRNDREAISL
jgi:hypothetical protein